MARTLESTREKFLKDRFANMLKIQIDEIGEGYAKCSLKIEDMHINGRGGVQGGAIFTLADYCFGVANDGIAVSLTSEISYLAATKGTVLYAEANRLKDGRTTVFYEIKVTDDLGKNIAFVTMTGFKVE